MSNRSHYVPAVIGLFLVLVQPSNFDADSSDPRRPRLPGFRGMEPLWVLTADDVEHMTLPLIPPRASVDCADLLSYDSVSLSPRQLTQVYYEFPGFWSAVDAQSGLLSCEWEGTDVDADGLSSHLSISVLSDAAEAFHAWGADQDYSEWYDQPVIANALGADSFAFCVGDDTSTFCSAEFEFEGYWVQFHFRRKTALSADQVTSIAPAVALADYVSGALHSGGTAAPAYEISPSSLDVEDSCPAIDGAGELREIIGSPLLPPPDEDFWYGPPGFDGATGDSAGLIWCSWNQEGEYFEAAKPTMPEGQIREVRLAILPGGEWSWQGIRDDVMGNTSINPTEVSLPDGTSVVVACFYQQCAVDALVRHSIVHLEFSYPYSESGVPTDAQALTDTVAFMPRFVDYLEALSDSRG